jgi:hypothetical protein
VLPAALNPPAHKASRMYSSADIKQQKDGAKRKGTGHTSTEGMCCPTHSSMAFFSSLLGASATGRCSGWPVQGQVVPPVRLESHFWIWRLSYLSHMHAHLQDARHTCMQDWNGHPQVVK